MNKHPHVAVVGATGAVGIEMIKTLEKRNFPVGKLTLLASARSVGKTLKFKGEAGDAVLYPSTTIHRVTPVTRGERLVGITWLQSYVASTAERELLLQIEELRALELRDRKDARAIVLLESLRTNLFRMWADT